MRLADLEPRFVRYEDRVEAWERAVGDPATWRERGAPTETITGPRTYSIFVEPMVEAQGLWLLCPSCFQRNNGSVGTHFIEVTFSDRGAMDHQGSHGKDGRPTRWTATGTSLEDLTTTPSILIDGDCAWHGYITNGDISSV